MRSAMLKHHRPPPSMITVHSSCRTCAVIAILALSLLMLPPNQSISRCRHLAITDFSQSLGRSICRKAASYIGGRKHKHIYAV
ncbi:hypothetical protein BDR03DRAFT_130074 [Suillus americanus]|nr:hypothetical protein BDR03DRAFT_130074 [Suillus americanus]